MHGAAACVTVNANPATVSVPVRGDGFGFAAAVNCASPDPVDDGGDTVNHVGSFDAAAHVHDGAVNTVTDPLPPAAGAELFDEGSENVHT